MLRGGPGNDTLYGGNSSDREGGSSSVTDTKYLYGDEGHDIIFSSDDLDFEYIWGGSGDDTIRGGNRVINQFINGNEGNDIIIPGDNSEDNSNILSSIIKGGKGDDIISPSTIVFNADGSVNFSDSNFGSSDHAGINWDGGDGDDIIWGNLNGYGD